MSQHDDEEPIGRDAFGAPLYLHQFSDEQIAHFGIPGSPDGPPLDADRLVVAKLPRERITKAHEFSTRLGEVTAIIFFVVLACLLVSATAWATAWLLLNFPGS